MTVQKSPVSVELKGLIERHKEEHISFNTIRDSLQDQGFCLLMIILAFPAALPLPYPPGFTTIVGIPLGLFALQMLLGFKMPWLPQWLGKRQIHRSLLVSLVERAIPLLHRVEHHIRPRFFVANTMLGEKLVGAVCLACAVLISIPIPFGHALPATAILFMALGFLARDGITIIIGIIIAIIGLGLDIAIVFAGTEAILGMFSFVKHHHHHSV